MLEFIKRLFHRHHPLVAWLRCRSCGQLWQVTRFADEGVDACPYCGAKREWRR